MRDLIKVVFLPNFNVTNGQKIYPAADLSEQISTAGKEASGTGNMKFQMNGALTIGTVDGANIEICEEVGVENFFLFGLEAHEVAARRAAGYQPDGVRRAETKSCRPSFSSFATAFSRAATARSSSRSSTISCTTIRTSCSPTTSRTRDCQALVDQTYRDKEGWTRMSILNSARSGKFSSDRTIREYCNDIWRIPSVPIKLSSDVSRDSGDASGTPVPLQTS